MASTVHQFHSRLGGPSAVRTADFFLEGALKDSFVRAPPSVTKCATLAVPKKPLGRQTDYCTASRRCLRFRCGFCAAPVGTAEPAVAFSMATLKPTTLYDVLGISDVVTDDEVKAAFRRIAKEVHPDQAPPDQVEEYQKKFMEVHKAYSVLKDPRTRSLYNYEIRNYVSSGSRQFKAEDWKRPSWRGCNWETDQCWTS